MMKKRILSFLLSVCMLASVCSGVTLSAFAESLPLEAKVDAAQPQTDEGEFLPVVEDVPLAFPYGEGGSRSETEEVSESLPLEGKVDAAQPQTDEGESLSVTPIETAQAEEVTAELQATYTGSCGTNLKWTLDTSTGTLTISGTGKMTDWDLSDYAPWYSYRSSIKTVSIEKGVTSIGWYAFIYCDSLTSVTIPDSVTSIGVLAFSYCSSLTSITIPDSVTFIGSHVFISCDSLTCVTIPDSVTIIGYRAFSYCDSLTSVTIGDSVTSIGEEAFSSCDSLTSITVSDGNTVYSSQDGVLFNKAKSTLICYPGGKTGAYTIPTGVTSIGEYAFFWCVSLTSITIPDSVTSIGSSAFQSCSSLTSIIYCGTEAQWNKISIGDYNAPLKNAARQYHAWNDGVITIQPTCTADGVMTYTCTHDASHSYTELIPSPGHNYETSHGTEPTCTDPGWALLICSSCSDLEYKDYAALGHDPVYHEAKAATCENVGWNAYETCTRCDYTTYEETPALGHEYIANVTKEATCTENGEMTYTCSHDVSHVYTETIPQLGHDMEVKQRLAPTKETEGYEIAVCSRCNHPTQTPLPKLGADPGDLNGDGERNAKDVTLMRRFLAGGYGVTLTNELIADTNKDGVVNAKDITLLRRAVADGYGVVLD